MERLTDAGAVFETRHHSCSTMQHHRHPVSFATIVLCGSYLEVRDTIPEICSAGTIVVHDAHEEHADRFALETRCLNVELPAMDGATFPAGTISIDGTRLPSAIENVVRAFYGSPDELLPAVKRFQCTLIERAPQTLEVRPHWLRNVIATFPWAQDVPLRTAAQQAGVHETHFSRAFRRHMGMTAHEYRNRARLHLASSLMLTTNDSLARIALGCGFSDQSHLTRTFSEKLGLTPAGYRRTFAR